MQYAIRILKDGQFQAYLSHKDRKAWSKRQAKRHIAEAKLLDHFQGCTFVLEPDQ